MNFSDNDNSPASRLRNLRKRMNLTQAEMGLRFNVSRNYINLMENGSKPVTSTMLELITCGEKGYQTIPEKPISSGHENEALPVERLPDGRLRYGFLRRWTEDELHAVLPDASSAGDYALMEDIAAELRRRKLDKKSGVQSG